MSFLKRLSPLQRFGLTAATLVLVANAIQNGKPNVVTSETEDASTIALCKMDGRGGSVNTDKSDVTFRAKGAQDSNPVVSVVIYEAHKTVVGGLSDLDGAFQAAAREARQTCNEAISVAEKNNMRRDQGLKIGSTMYGTGRVLFPSIFVFNS